MLFTGLLLTISENIQKERSLSSIYHLLTGAKRIQTQQDAPIFYNEPYYGIYKDLKKSDFDEKIYELLRHELIKEEIDDKGRKVIAATKKGASWLAAHQASLPLHYFQGMLFQDITYPFYRRLLLFIQTLSNIKENYFTFIPVVTDKDAENFVRSAYHELKGKEKNVLHNLFHELQTVLEQTTDEIASIFVDRLSGYQHYGKSIDQLSNTFKKEKHDIYLLLVCAVHALLRAATTQHDTYRILYFLTKDLEHTVLLTDSAEKTYKLFKLGYPLKRISEIRRLKINTIYDHITEIALNDPLFPFEQFVPKQSAEEILEKIELAGTSKLKVIKEMVPSDISYFQIRLMFIYHHKERRGETDASVKVLRE
jgi:uncharacterized protein YpbB